ncbi:MAG: GtrA family protein [Gammaproteobacteria bacterium]|nr:GtrA family protein [Gammaproteobacteria bacterium]
MVALDNTVATVMLFWHVYGRQFIKYILVAFFGLLLHLGILSGLVELAGIHYTIAFVLALPFTAASKFLMHRSWTFRK